MAGRLPSSYLSTTWRVPCTSSCLSETSRTKPSSRSTSQMRCFILLAGRSISSSPARCALRMRVNRSATGSVMLICDCLRRPYPWARRLMVGLPRRLDHSRDLALEGAVAEADAAHLELVEERPAAAAQLAARIGPHLELRLLLQALRLRNLGKLGHLSRRPEGHAHVLEESAALFVAPRRGHDGDVHALDLLD